MLSGAVNTAHQALCALNAARDALAHSLQLLSASPVEEQLAVAREIEAFRNRWTEIDVFVIAGLDNAEAAEILCQGNLRRVLTSALGISKPKAARRVHAYEQLGPRRSMLGEDLGPLRPILARAVAAGEVSAEKAAIIIRGLTSVDRAGFDAADIAAGEKLLVDDAKLFNPEELRMLTQRVVDNIDPDGTLPKEKLQHDRRHFEMHPTADGGYAGRFRLTTTCGIKLATLLRPLSVTRVDDPFGGGEAETDTDDVRVSRGKVIDERTYGQRQHDALEDCCDRLLREGTVRENNAPVSVIVTIDEADVTRRTGHATTTSGDLIPPQRLSRWQTRPTCSRPW